MAESLWYVVNVFSGFEKKVAQEMREQAERNGLEDYFEEVLVPSESVVEVRRGAKITVDRNYYPGYVLVKMVMTDTTWHLVKNLPKVSGFLGAKGGNKPTPVSKREIDKIMNKVQEGKEKPRHNVNFEIGEQVRVTEGPFASFNGNVEEIDEEKSRLKVSVMIFGRATPVELEFSQVEKA